MNLKLLNQPPNKYTSSNYILSPSKITKIKQIIKNNFIQRSVMSDEITQEFIDREYGIVLSHINIKFLYSYESVLKIKNIMFNYDS